MAILFAEPGYLDLVDRILEAETVRVGAPTLVEAGMVLAGRRGAPGNELVELVRELAITVVPFGEAESHRASQAFAGLAADATRPASTSATASPTAWRRQQQIRFSLSARTSNTPTSAAPADRSLL